MTVITRFAPSPTGLLHIGNARTALISYMFAKLHGGKFMLRLDDTDTQRSTEEYAIGLQEDLKWLGLEWDIFARQSDRINRYNEIKAKLVKDGRLYPCYETAQEIDIKRKMQLNRGLPPIYDRAALNLTDAQIKQFEDEGRVPHWRFKLDEAGVIQWNDLVKGPVQFEADKLSDPILIRENGEPTYMLPSAIDDMDFNITHVVRGEDHVTNTAIQIQLFRAIGTHMPEFVHLSLIKGKEGKISKREGGFDIKALREEGVEPMAISSFIARLGTSEPTIPTIYLKELVDSFHLEKFSKAAAIYDSSELERMNSKILHMMPYSEVKDRQEMKNIDEEFWVAVRPNLTRLGEIQEWWKICHGNILPIVEDAHFLVEAAEVLPAGNWDENTWGQWIEKIKQITPRRGKDLFMPLRKALTARDSGPELKYVLPLIGREKVISRLSCGNQNR